MGPSSWCRALVPTKPTNFSPLAVAARVTPTDRTSAEFRTEWDPTAHTLRSFFASGSFQPGEWLNVSGSWIRRR